MRWTIVILILCGCAAQKSSPPPLPKVTPIPKTRFASQVPAAMSEFTLSYHRDFYLPIQYPADASNYTWYLQQSLDNSNWTTIQTFYGGPSNYNYDVSMGTNRIKFWRMKGVKP